MARPSISQAKTKRRRTKRTDVTQAEVLDREVLRSYLNSLWKAFGGEGPLSINGLITLLAHEWPTGIRPTQSGLSRALSGTTKAISNLNYWSLRFAPLELHRQGRFDEREKQECWTLFNRAVSKPAVPTHHFPASEPRDMTYKERLSLDRALRDRKWVFRLGKPGRVRVPQQHSDAVLRDVRRKSNVALVHVEERSGEAALSTKRYWVRWLESGLRVPAVAKD